MDKFIATIHRIEKLNTEEALALKQFTTVAQTRFLKKGEYLLKPGEANELMVHIDTGMLRQYLTDANGNEKILQLYTEGCVFEDCTNLTIGNTMQYAIQALEDCELTCFSLHDILQISDKYPVFQKVGSLITSINLQSYNEHTAILMKYSPEERYKYMLEHKAALVQRLSVTHLAQYLDMSRETLSRMRAKVFEISIL